MAPAARNMAPMIYGFGAGVEVGNFGAHDFYQSPMRNAPLQPATFGAIFGQVVATKKIQKLRNTIW